MKCLNSRELEQFLTGKLDTERSLAADEHITMCGLCKAAIEGLPVRRTLDAGLAARLLGVEDCPEYEELSALVDHRLTTDRASLVQAHVGSCELCTRDLGRITELRSHAAMRERVTVRPGMSVRRTSSPWLIWKRTLAAAGLAAAVAGLAIGFGLFNAEPENTTTIARVTNPPKVNRTTTTPGGSDPGSKPVAVAPTVTPEDNTDKIATGTPGKTPTPARPLYATVLKDGAYKVVEREGRLALAKSNGSLVRGPLEAQIAASIEQKLRTGKIKPSEPVLVALNSVRLRGSDYTPPPTAPKQLGPMGKILETAAPTLSWTAVDMADSYRVRIFDGDGRAVAEHITTRTSFTPSTPLERGQVYAWRVAVRFGQGDDWADSASARFKVLSAESFEAIQSVRTQLPGSHLALGAVYESVGLFAEADAEYAKVRSANPNAKLAGKLQQTAQPGE